MSTERIPGNVRRRQAMGEMWRWIRPDGTLERMPASPADRQRLLAFLAERFENDREYTEIEVNEALTRIDRDTATLRRYLVDAGLMVRSGGFYRRV